MWSFSYPIEERYYDAPLPRISIPLLDEAPIPSLPLKPEDLEHMVEIPFLVNYMDGTESPDRARFWVAYDAEGFLIAGKLHAPSHGRTDVVEDQIQHEQLHIIINPTPSMLRGYRIRLRPDRVMAIDAGGEDAPRSWWGKEGRLVQEVEKDGWSFAVKIPYTLLGVKQPNPGEMWRMNLFRYLFKRQEDNTSWSVMYLGRVDIPERYGEVVFGGKGLCGGINDVSIAPGKSRMSFHVDNLGDSTASLILEVLHNGHPLVVRNCVARPGKNDLALGFDLPDGGHVLLILKNGKGEPMVVWPVNTSCSPLKPRIKNLHHSINKLISSTSRGITEEGRHIREELMNLQHRVAAGGNGAESWHILEAEMGRLEYDASILAQRSRLGNPEVPAALLATHTLTKIMPDLPLPDIFSQKAELKAPRRGSDSAQLIILSFNDNLSDCDVNVSPLKGPESSEIPASNLEIWRVGNVVTRRPRYTARHVGAHPDPLLPPNAFTVPKGRHEVLWLTVNVPDDARPGIYEGFVQIRISNSEVLMIPLSLKVWNFELPIRSTLRTAFPMFEGEIKKFYGRPVTRDQRWLYYDFLLRRHVSPSCQYEKQPRPRIEDLEVAMDRGSNVISMGYLDYQDLDVYVEGLRPMVEFLRKKGWVEWAYVYGFDEVGPPGYPKLTEAYGKVKETYPDLPRACTIGPEQDIPRIFGTVDIWIPQTDRFERVYKDRQSRGDQLWWYVSMWPRHPFANMFIDYEAIDHRILFWQTWKYGITGFLYYCINLWSSNCRGHPSLEREVAGLPDPMHRDAIDKGARWPQVPWNTYTGPTATNGDGQLIYPGPDGGPLTSIRLECVRHGIEDYEMFAVLEKELERLVSFPNAAHLMEEGRDLLGIPSEVCRDLTHYTDDPTILLKTRERLGCLLERMAKIK